MSICPDLTGRGLFKPWFDLAKNQIEPSFEELSRYLCQRPLHERRIPMPLTEKALINLAPTLPPATVKRFFAGNNECFDQSWKACSDPRLMLLILTDAMQRTGGNKGPVTIRHLLSAVHGVCRSLFTGYSTMPDHGNAKKLLHACLALSGTVETGFVDVATLHKNIDQRMRIYESRMGRSGYGYISLQILCHVGELLIGCPDGRITESAERHSDRLRYCVGCLTRFSRDVNVFCHTYPDRQTDELLMSTCNAIHEHGPRVADIIEQYLGFDAPKQ